MKKYWLLILIMTSAILLVHCSQRNNPASSIEKNVTAINGTSSYYDQTVINDDEIQTNTVFEFYNELKNRPVNGKQ